MTKRIEWIDALKGFAILTVVIGHCTTDSMASHTYADYAVWIQMIYDFVYSFHMPLFFMVSGYVFYLTKSYRKWKEKVRDFTIVYVIWCTLMWLSKYLMSGDVNHPVTIIDLLTIVYKPIMVYWYLYVLILFYAIFSCFKWEKLSWGFLATLAGVATITKMAHLDIGIVNAALYHMFYFAAGGVILQKEILQKIKISHLCLLGVLILANGLLYLQDISWPPAVLVCKNFIFANIVSLFAFSIFSKTKSIKALVTMGFYTMPIYVIHCFFTGGLRILIGRLHVSNIYLYFFAATLLGILIPILCGKMAKRILWMNILFEPGKVIRH